MLGLCWGGRSVDSLYWRKDSRTWSLKVVVTHKNFRVECCVLLARSTTGVHGYVFGSRLFGGVGWLFGGVGGVGFLAP